MRNEWENPDTGDKKIHEKVRGCPLFCFSISLGFFFFILFSFVLLRVSWRYQGFAVCSVGSGGGVYQSFLAACSISSGVTRRRSSARVRTGGSSAGV